MVRCVVILVLLLSLPLAAQTPDVEVCEDPVTLLYGYEYIDGDPDRCQNPLQTNQYHLHGPPFTDTVDVGEDITLEDVQLYVSMDG